jgi:hypothetical protein
MAQNSKKLEDGRDIIAREHNTEAPHPNPMKNGELVPFHNVNKLLVLDPNDPDSPDGVTLFECDPCGKVWPTARQVVSHMAGAHVDRGPEYKEDVIKTVLRVVAQHRASGARNFQTRAADELNHRGIPTARGGPWSPGMMHMMVKTYGAQYPVRIRRDVITTTSRHSGAPSTSSTAKSGTISDISDAPRRRGPDLRPRKNAASVAATSASTVHRIKVHTISDAVATVDHLTGVAMKIAGDATALVREVERLRQDIADAVAREAAKPTPTPAPEIDPEIVEKAKLYDQFSGLFGSLIQNNQNKK